VSLSVFLFCFPPRTPRRSGEAAIFAHGDVRRAARRFRARESGERGARTMTRAPRSRNAALSEKPSCRKPDPDFHSDGTRSHGVRARAVCNENLSQWRRESLSHLAPGTCLARVAARANELFTHQASLAESRTTVRFHFLNFRSLGGDPSLIKNL